MKGLIFDIKHYAIHDGPGIRTTVFLKGCPMQCLWCHNPESHSEFSNPDRDRWVTAGDVTEEVMRDRVFYEESGGGMTLSGGEPLMQAAFVTEVFRQCKQAGIHTTLDTCGYAARQDLCAVLVHTDLVLYDLKVMDDSLHRRYTGVSNEKVLDNFHYLAATGKDMIIRYPVIPGITDGTGNMEKIRDVVTGKVREIHLLPYHLFSGNKYERMGRHFALQDIPEPGKEHLEGMASFFRSSGLHVQTGG